jgi:hypothetical protein
MGSDVLFFVCVTNNTKPSILSALDLVFGEKKAEDTLS